MYRRDLLRFLGVVAAWPRVVRAQQQPKTPANEGHVADRRTLMPENGLVSVQSRSPAPETVERLLSVLAKRKLTVFARVDHAAGAASVGLQLRPTELVIFGNPQGGTALMQDRQSAGIDLPLKALIWQDSDSKTWLTYNDPNWIAQRHSLGTSSAPAVKAMAALLAAIAQEATSGS